MEKLGWRDRRISPDSGSLFQTILRFDCLNFIFIISLFRVSGVRGYNEHLWIKLFWHFFCY